MNTDNGKSPMRLISVPLDALERHADNVRKTPADGEADAVLAASIRAHGLLSPLIVEGSEERARVIGGGRRLQALSTIAGEGGLPQDHPVPCVLIEGDGELGLGAVIELSLAENTGRARMHVADEALAFTALRKTGATDRDLARRFGTSPRTIQRRLRIGRCAPELLDRLRNGELSLQAIEAAALTADHKTQIAAVAAGLKHWDPIGRIRRYILGDRPRADGTLASFVGLAAYEERGGTLKSDPATGVDFLNDRALVEQIAREKLAAEAKKLSIRGWGLVTFGLSDPDEWWKAYDRIPSKAPPSADGEHKARLHLTPNRDGEVSRLALVPKKEAAKTTKKKEAAAKPLSRSLVDDIRMHRLGIEREALARADPGLARDILLMQIAVRDTSPLGIDVHAPDSATDLAGGAAPQCVVRADAVLRDAAAPLFALRELPTVAERWQALRAMPEQERRRLLAVCVARQLRSPGIGQLAELEIDWPSEWRADRRVLNRMTRSQLFATGLVGSAEAEEFRALKKSELVEQLAAKIEDGEIWLPLEVFGGKA